MGAGRMAGGNGRDLRLVNGFPGQLGRHIPLSPIKIPNSKGIEPSIRPWTYPPSGRTASVLVPRSSVAWFILSAFLCVSSPPHLNHRSPNTFVQPTAGCGIARAPLNGAFPTHPDHEGMNKVCLLLWLAGGSRPRASREPCGPHLAAPYPLLAPPSSCGGLPSPEPSSPNPWPLQYSRVPS
ncbi:hypothetical protein VTI74DRAFT_10841 [Chaetomium olivicolor]